MYSRHVLRKDLVRCISPVKRLVLLQDDLSGKNQHGNGVEFPQTYAISYDFEFFKEISHNLELLSFQ